MPRDFRGPQEEIFICMCGTWLVLPVRLMIDQGKCARYSAPNGTLPFPPLALEAFYSINPGPWSVKTHKHTPHTHTLTLIITYTSWSGTPWPPLCSEKHTQPSFCLSGPAVAPFATGYRCSWCQLTKRRRAGCCRSRSPAFCFSALFFISLLMCFQGRWVCVWSCDEYSGHLTLRVFVSNLHCMWNRYCCSASARSACPLFVRYLCTFSGLC